MIPRFFIDRPIFASVLSIVLTLAGGVAVFNLPIAQYPEVTPPTVVATAVYPGANCLTVRDTVAAPIEEQVSGVEGMMYMSSQCTNDGTYILTVTFQSGMSSDVAQVLVQNRVSLATPVIPALVQREGITVKKQSPNTLMIVNLTSEGVKLKDLQLSNYATIEIRDELGRLPGVAGIGYLGQRDYSMRIWLNPDKLAAVNLTASDVVTAISQQNIQVAAGQIGEQPAPRGQQFQLTINTRGQLVDPGEFENIVVKAGSAAPTTSAPTASTSNAAAASVSGSATILLGPPSGAPNPAGSPTESTGAAGPSQGIVLVRDVAEVILGAQQYEQTAALDGKPTVALTIYGLPGANAIATAEGVYSKMAELSKRFPAGMKYEIVYDTTPFIRQSVQEVYRTLIDAVLLVALVVLIFLQNWGAAVIPLAAVPVAIIGTFAVMIALNFSLNNLSLFGLVLVGLASKNAILIVEFAKQRFEEGSPRYEAAVEASRLRLRPILMTSFAFIFGVIPLIVSQGAGAEMRQSLGIAVFSGMLGVTLFGIFLTPVFFYLVQWIKWTPAPAAPPSDHESPLPPTEQVQHGPALFADGMGRQPEAKEKQ